MFYLLAGIFLLAFLIHKWLNAQEKKSSKRVAEGFLKIHNQFYQMGYELQKSGKPYEPPNNGRLPKGKLAKAMLGQLTAIYKKGYNDAAEGILPTTQTNPTDLSD